MGLQAWRPDTEGEGEVLQSWFLQRPAPWLVYRALSLFSHDLLICPPCVCVLASSSCEDTGHVGLESTLTASFPSVPSLKALSPQTATP